LLARALPTLPTQGALCPTQNTPQSGGDSLEVTGQVPAQQEEDIPVTIPIRDSDIELLEETERVEPVAEPLEGRVNAVGIRAFKALEVLRETAKKERATTDEQTHQPDEELTTVRICTEQL